MDSWSIPMQYSLGVDILKHSLVGILTFLSTTFSEVCHSVRQICEPGKNDDEGDHIFIHHLQ
jgi:hypothetical protein